MMVEIASVYSSSYVSPFQPSDPDNEKKENRRTNLENKLFIERPDDRPVLYKDGDQL